MYGRVRILRKKLGTRKTNAEGSEADADADMRKTRVGTVWLARSERGSRMWRLPRQILLVWSRCQNWDVSWVRASATIAVYHPKRASDSMCQQ